MFITTTCRTRTRFKDDDEIRQASESYLESMQQEFYLTGIKELFDKCTYALLLRVIMLNNNIKIMLVSFVHHIELQNFLNAPRSYGDVGTDDKLKVNDMALLSTERN